MKNYIRYVFLLSFSTFWFSSVFSQQVATENKTLRYSDGQEVFDICKSNPNLNYDDKLDYFWYNKYSGISSTKGGAGGQLLHGKYQMFDSKGKLKKEAHFSLGLQHGLSRSWDEEGNIIETYKYDKGLCNYMKFFNDEGFIIEWTGVMFQKGSIKKVYTKYDVLLQESTFIDQFKSNVKEYYESYGTSILKAEYTSGVGNFYYGSYKSYFKNGQLEVEGEFIENLRTGDWKYYNIDGSIKGTVQYRIFKEKYPNGNLKIQGSQYLDKETNTWIKDGRWLYYEEYSNDYKKIEEYEYGKLIKVY